VRIGILLTLPEQERKKGELISCGDEEWCKKIPKQFVFERTSKKFKKYGKYGYPTDVATGAYIQHALKEKDVEVDFILPSEITKARLASNDLNFLMIYDILEAFHTDKTDAKTVYNNLKKCLLGAQNVYPPREYQEFVYSKINYYNYLKEKNVSIIPTFTMTSEEYHKLGHEAAMKKVLAFWDEEKLGRVICKPVYGQEAKDLEFFNPTPKDKGRMKKYFRKCQTKYPGLVMQKCVKGFGNSPDSPELRMYYMGQDYKYSVCAGRNCILKHPIGEGGDLPCPIEKLKTLTKKILNKLPPIVMPNGAKLPRLITRLDMGWRVEGKYHPFVNEVEFVPSLYSEYKPLRPEIDDYIAHCAKQMVKITKCYIKSRKGSGKSSLRQVPTPMSRSRSATTRPKVLKSHTLKRKTAAR